MGLIISGGSGSVSTANGFAMTDTSGANTKGITFGSDTVLYRSAADTLKTDDNLIIGINGGKTTLSLSNTTANVGITIGADTNLYRSAASTLKTDADFKAVGRIDANAGASNGQVSVGSGGINRITFGLAEDTMIKRETGGVFSLGTGAAKTAPTITGFGLMIENVGTAPSTNPVGGPIIYAEAGALKCRGTGGTVVTLCAA